MTVSNSSASRSIVTAWLVAGSLDILTACLYFWMRTGKDPLRVLYFVASGLFGKTALTGGIVYAAAGLLLHYLIALSFTLFFFLIYPHLRFLSWNKWLTSLLYGSFVWIVMNCLIVPMSLTSKSPFRFDQAVVSAMILIVMIGMPLTWIIGKYYSHKGEGAG